MLLIGQKAPNFKAQAVMPDNSISDSFEFADYTRGKCAVLFFYPLDFTFVCPSEIIALNARLAEFQKRNASVILVSVDSCFSHLAYKNVSTDKGGIGDIQIPMVGDLTQKIASDYGVLSAAGIAFRGTFIIDKKGVVRQQSINDFPLGRNVDEILRLLDALEHHEKHGEVCPANWKQGDAAITPTAAGIESYLAANAKKL